ncbi:TonB-dependent receptor plug domain-containing protein [Olleya sp. Bg11-27]|uniref:TonB-dependent receptor plug domain-containing protein n=1 Tax=Olleya sp. Bg11-27 TaxID=2058135 RepID=UPI000C3027B2|nr:TonB-dependent receptor [Olleya sp. Bg11-27]AUC74526.1 TonB-dependent receptor [Olleya sp. Bg11-27]
MILNKNYLTVYFIFFCVVILSAQEKTKNTTNIEVLEEVIITGESNVMSLSKKLFTVNTIKRKDIENVAGNTLADVLFNNLNISINPDASSGKSTVSLFGLDGQYVKILIDGIPIVSDNGVGNNIDITQINLDDVERVEIVEGSMGVLYGDNAVAGVINIITKRGLKNNGWELQLALQEESVGNEFDFFNKGRHIQNFKITNQVNDKLSYSIGTSRNDFSGFYNDYKGQNYVNVQDGAVVNDGLRGTEWNPKDQITTSLNVDLDLGKHNFFYKLQYFNEDLEIYNRSVNGRYEDGRLNPTALDKNYRTNRWVSNLNASGSLIGDTKYNLSLSYQNQKRNYKEYVYNILNQKTESIQTDAVSQSSNIWYSKAFVNNIIPNSEVFNFQLGYEFTNQSGYDAIATGNYSSDVVKNTITNYELFGITEFNVNKKLSINPGIRFTHSSQFNNHLIWSLSSTYDFTEKLKLKAVVGSAYRAPNFEELFFYFVDSNHNVRGNPNLQPEDGLSVFVNLKDNYKINEDAYLKAGFNTFYIELNDAIASVTSEDDNGSVLFTQDNIDYSKRLGFTLDNNFIYKNWNIGLGATYLGTTNAINKSLNNTSDYLWALNLQTSINYKIEKWNTNISSQLKYNGKTQGIFYDTNGELFIGETDAYTWLNLSLKTNITPKLSTTLGVRNLLDVVDINTGVSAGAHSSSTSTSRLIGNGRSFFLKLTYNLNFNTNKK